MGQYYKCVNVVKKQYMEPSSVKLTEHSWVGNEALSKAMELLSPGGSWYKDRIIWVGDYADEELIDENGDYFGWTEDPLNFEDQLLKDSDGEYVKLYHVEEVGSWEKITFERLDDTVSEEIIKRIQQAELKKVLVNHTKKEYFLMREQEPNEYDMIVHPLSLLTASGNGRGMGDYRGMNEEQVGRWSGDSISVEDEAPEGYTKLEFTFKE